MAKNAKNYEIKVDGLSDEDIKKIRSALRKVWSWSWPHRLVKKRCVGSNGFLYCEQCFEMTPQIFVDHIVACGRPTDGGYIRRMWAPSKNLQGLCKKCHAPKTAEERRQARMRKKLEDDGFK